MERKTPMDKRLCIYNFESCKCINKPQNPGFFTGIWRFINPQATRNPETGFRRKTGKRQCTIKPRDRLYK